MTRRYSTQGLWSLFLTCAFPLHVWTIILVFRDVSWVAARTDVWDAVGLGAYALTFAFVESLIVFAVFALLGFFTPNHWAADKRIAFLNMLVLLLSAWGILSQLLFLWNVSLPSSAIRYLAHSGHPLRILYAASLAVVLPSISIPAYLFLRSDKLFRFIHGLTERLAPLTMFYLSFDLIGFIIVVLRNIS